MSLSFLQELATQIGPRSLIRDPAAVAPWLTDWRGRYHGAALALAAPADTAEAAAIVRTAAKHRVPIVPQGGNTSMVGGATPAPDGTALLLSLRRMNRIRRLSAEDAVVVAEAGVILSDLHSAAAEAGMRFPLSLGAKGSATVGGLTATNAGGTQVLRFGTMRSLVLGIEAVLPDGFIFDSLLPLKKDNRGPDLKQLLIGSEGTLGIVTAVSLKLVPAVRETATAWAGLRNPQDALTLLRRLEGEGLAVESFELVPRDSLRLVLDHIPGTRAPLPHAHPWNALVEVTGGGARAGVETGLTEALESELIQDATIADRLAQAEAFWRIRDSISEAERASGPAVQHDISVPVSAMPDFMLSAASAAERAFPGTSASAFGHLGDGNVHFHVRAPAGAHGENWLRESGPAISRLVYDLVTDAGGSISAEHGIGQMKIDTFARLGDPVRIGILQAIKAALDPLGIMNPGKLIPPQSPEQASLASPRSAP